MKCYRRILPCLLLLLAVQASIAQRIQLPKVEHLGTKDGLPFRDIPFIAQDQQGFFWLSSKLGVVRYDGYQFVPLRKLAKNGYLLPPAFTRVFTLQDGTLLLVADEKSFFVYDQRRNEISIHPIHDLTGRKQLPIQTALLCFEKDGSFLFEWQENSRRYLVRFTEGKGVSRLDSVPHYDNNMCTVRCDINGNIFWGTAEAGIRLYSAGKGLVDSLQLGFVNDANPGKLLFSLNFYLNANGQVLASDYSNQEMVLWDWKKKKVQPLGLHKAEFANYYTIDAANNLWLFYKGTDTYMLDAQHQLHDISQFLSKKADFYGVYFIMEDAQHQIWISSDNGIFKLSAPGNGIVHYLSDPQPKWAHTTRGFFEDKNGIVHFRCENCGDAAENTIYRINQLTDKAESIAFKSTDDANKSLMRWTKHLPKSPDGKTVWAAGFNGLLQFDLYGRFIKKIEAVPADQVNNQTANAAIALTKKGEVLAGGRFRQLFAYDPVTEKVRQLQPKCNEEDKNGLIKAILEAKDGTLWVGLEQGLFQLEPQSGKLLKHFNSTTHRAFLTNGIQVLHEDPDGTIWAGTYGGGLVRINPKTGEAVSFTTADGLPDNIIAAILPWKTDYLWVSTFNGLTCFNKKDKTFVNFYEEDGLSHNEFNLSSAFIDSRGRYYFGGMNGVNAFYPEDLMKPQSKPLPLLLTGFSFYDEKKDTFAEQFGSLQSLQEVTLSPHVSWFQFNYALPDYVNPKLNQFKTWLENFEKDWIYQGNTPFIRYNRLPAGDYVLHIRAADSKGYWSDDELAIRITVQQVFYKTWWFILLCCLAVGAGGFALLRYRYQQRLALEQMRTRIASDLHDEVGSSLSHLNFLVGAFDMENSPETTAKAIEKSKELMRKTASNIRDVVWAIDARRDKTGDLLDRMEDFAFDMFSVKNIACRFQTDGVNREAVLNPFVRQNIFLVFKEAVNNIAKHSNATEVNISLSQTGASLELTVADNGKSASPGKPSTGLGLENMQMRAKRIGGSLAIENSGTGWTVRLRVA